MSYNIDDVSCPVLEAWMEAEDIVNLLDEHEDRIPEGNFLEEHSEAARAALKQKRVCACGAKSKRSASFCSACGAPLPAADPSACRIQIKCFDWHGEGSSSCYNFLLETVAPKIHGSIDAVLTWEGGDFLSGLRIRDGVVEVCDVVQTLVPRVKRRST